MWKDIWADIILEPITCPDAIRVTNAEIDSVTKERTGKAYVENGTSTLEEIKRRLPVSIYAWPRHEEKLAKGETVYVVSGPTSVFFDED